MTGREIGAIAMIIFAIWFLIEPKQPSEKQTANPDDVRVMKSVGGELVVSNKGKVSPEEDYEMDLTERCKDWIFYRNKTLQLGRAGDTEGANKARRAMFSYMDGLEQRFSNEQIANEISRQESSGIK